jgi:hypothetical protein
LTITNTHFNQTFQKKTMEQILSDIRHIIAETRGSIARSINHQKTIAYWNIGRRIVQEEQGGIERAKYGKN